jgi:hypothetical protein
MQDSMPKQLLLELRRLGGLEMELRQRWEEEEWEERGHACDDQHSDGLDREHLDDPISSDEQQDEYDGWQWDEYCNARDEERLDDLISSYEEHFNRLGF